MKSETDYTWWSSSSGQIEIQIPNEAIDACSHSGECFGDVQYWTPQIDWTNITRDTLELVLDEYGAWEDLSTVDVETLKQRITWLACGDLSEEAYQNKESNQ